MRRLVLALGAALAMLAVAAPAFGQGQAQAPDKLDVFLYADTVNGTRPAGAKARPLGCTQTSTFIRGEQLVFRVWGTAVGSGDILSTENVKYAYVKIPGQPNLKLNWGPHGPTNNRTWFWTAAFNVPADYPLGSASFQLVFKTEEDKFGIQDYLVNIVPALKTPQR